MTDEAIERRLCALGEKMRTYGLTAGERAERTHLQMKRSDRIYRTRRQIVAARAKLAALERQAARYGLTC